MSWRPTPEKGDETSVYSECQNSPFDLNHKEDPTWEMLTNAEFFRRCFQHRVVRKRQEDQEHWNGIRDVPSNMHGNFTRTESDPKSAVSAMSPEQKIGVFRRHTSEKSMLPGQASSAARRGSLLP